MSIAVEMNRMEPLDADGFPRRPPPQLSTSQSNSTIPVSPIQTAHLFSPSQLTTTSTTTPISTMTTSTTTTTTTTTTTSPDEPTSTRPPTSATGPFSFPALHLGSFSSLRIDDFADYATSSPVDPHPTNDKDRGKPRLDESVGHGGSHERTGQVSEQDGTTGRGGFSLGLPLLPSSLGSPTKSVFPGGRGTPARPSPTLYDVTRMARSGSPFRPIVNGNAYGSGPNGTPHQPPGASSSSTGFAQKINSSDSQARGDGNVNGSSSDYLIDSPGFLSEEGSKTFFRQSQVVRRRTVVSGGIVAERGKEGGDDHDEGQGGGGEERMNEGQGSRDGVVMGEGVGVASRKASAVGDVESEEDDDPDHAVRLPGSSPTQTTAPPPNRPSMDGPRFPSSSSMESKQRRRLPSAPSARSISSGQIESSQLQQDPVNGGSAGQPIDIEEKRRQAQSVFERRASDQQGLGPLSGSTTVMMDGSGQPRSNPILPTGALHPDVSSSAFPTLPVVARSFSASQVPQTHQAATDVDRSRRVSNTAGRTPPKAHVALPSIQDRANASPNLDALPSFPMFPAMERDEGPYPSYARPRKSMEPEDPTTRRSEARISNGKYRPGADGVPLRIKVPPPQEEICLECLMRDRDLMHVDVTGEGVWERASDVDWRERLEREDMCVQQFRRDPENRRKRDECEGEARARLESMLLREEDALVTREARWRGFSWEEGPDGTGLPRHFRGHVGGELLEERLKELATKMSAPAAHRFKTLQVYLRDQALSVGLVHPMARRAELDAGMSRQGMVSPSPATMTPRTHDPNLRVSQSHGILHESADYNRAPAARRPQQHGQYLDPAQRSTMYAKPAEEPMYQHGQGPLYTRSKTIPAIALGSPIPVGRDQSPHARAPPVQLDLRKGRGISSPGLLEGLSPDPNGYDDPTFNDRSSARYDSADQASIADSQIRPFSFAVWAGNGQHSARSSPGPGGRDRRNSAFGRWGGSVTSFFSGSQGGASGSMMDMHLGLDQDRRRGIAPSTPQPHPRSVSMASPPRPNFFSRASASFQNHSPSLYRGQQGNTTSTSDSASFVDERKQAEPVTTEKPKKKGFKGFLQKLGGGNKKRPSSGSGRDSFDRSACAEDDFASPLPPPPSLSMLVERSDRRTKHNRTPSNSSLSGPPTGPGSQPAYTSGRQSMSNDQMQPRSVSAPIVESPSKTSLPSASPTSSRYPYGREYSSGGGPGGAYKRDSYASSSTGRRRSSNPGLFQASQDAADDRRMGATIEVLEGDDGQATRLSAYAEDSPQFANARFSQDRGGPGSMTNSSGTILAPSIETPMMGQSMSSPYYKADGDRQKNLPPLPPGQYDYAREDNSSPMRSPDSFNAFFGQGVTMSSSTPRSPYQSHGRIPSSGQRSFASGMSLNNENHTQQPRKTKSKFGLKGLFSAGSKNEAAQMNSRADERYSRGPYDNNEFEDLSRAKSAGPQWVAQAPSNGLPSILQTARPMRQPYDEQTRRTYHQ